MRRDRSNSLYSEACRVIPGGVNSPVRAFRAVGGRPLFVSRASGSRLWDADNNEYIDYVGSWGPMISGHAHPAIVEAVQLAAASGTSFGAPTEAEVRLAEMIRDAVPSMEMVRLVSSGTEATMSAVRAARGFTGRSKIIKFEGCYHGHADFLLAKAGSGAMTLGVPDSAGVPSSLTSDTIPVPYNDRESLGAAADAAGDQLAAIIVEPVAGNMGCVPPDEGFLTFLRETCDRVGAVLILDEVMTGFRSCRGGAQKVYGVAPDLTAVGKIVGGGLPLGAYGGRSEIMRCVAPEGPVYQAGTLSGNPIATAAGIAQLELLDEAVYEQLEARSAALEQGLNRVLSERGVSGSIQRAGSMLTLFFRPGRVRNYNDARGCDLEAFGRFHRSMLERGIYLPPSQFECWFVSAAHNDEDIQLTLGAASECL